MIRLLLRAQSINTERLGTGSSPVRWKSVRSSSFKRNDKKSRFTLPPSREDTRRKELEPAYERVRSLETEDRDSFCQICCKEEMEGCYLFMSGTPFLRVDIFADKKPEILFSGSSTEVAFRYSDKHEEVQFLLLKDMNLQAFFASIFLDINLDLF